ncbi:MAG: hypothetical protein ABSG63_01900 [Spirochaetia bacterium]|jgi:hypothetical protein
MKIRKLPLDVFIIGGFITGFFYGFLNPLYVSVILARLDGRIIAMGTFMSSAFPVLIGAAMGNKRVFQRLYRWLPFLMLAELAAAIVSAVIAFTDVRAYYLASMFVLGVFSSSVVYLLQKIKEKRYRRARAAFDRRCDMADAVGLVCGSALSIGGFTLFSRPEAVALLGAAQTLIIYGLFLLLYRTVPAKSGRGEKEPPPWRLMIPRIVNAAA